MEENQNTFPQGQEAIPDPQTIPEVPQEAVSDESVAEQVPCDEAVQQSPCEEELCFDFGAFGAAYVRGRERHPHFPHAAYRARGVRA